MYLPAPTRAQHLNARSSVVAVGDVPQGLLEFHQPRHPQIKRHVHQHMLPSLAEVTEPGDCSFQLSADRNEVRAQQEFGFGFGTQPDVFQISTDADRPDADRVFVYVEPQALVGNELVFELFEVHRLIAALALPMALLPNQNDMIAANNAWVSASQVTPNALDQSTPCMKMSA